jgi:hypothetical protein
MSITLEISQSPILISPSNTNHIYNVRTSAYTLTDFQYICDVYQRPSEVVWSGTNTDNRVARLKLLPNVYGNAILDLEEIVRTLLNANPRASGQTYPYLNPASDVNSVITLMSGLNTVGYNAFNLWAGGSPNASVDQLWHVQEYRAIFGYSYLSGGSIVEVVNRTASYQPESITIFPAVDNKLIPTPYLSGATISTGTTAIGPNWFQYNNLNHLYYDLWRHQYFSGQSHTDTSCNYDVESCSPSEFLNAAGWDYKIISQSDVVDTRVRTRKHHPDCPIIVSFLNGKNPYFINDIYSLAIRSSDSVHGDYTYSAETINRSSTSLPSTIEPIDTRFKMGVFYLPYNVTDDGTNVIPTDSRKVCFYGTSYQANKSDRLAFSNRTTEILEFVMQERSCINTPIHVLFLNANGMWDTYTFGGKTSKTLDITRPSYRQEMSLNKQFYNIGAYQRGTKIYEQELDRKWECETWYMTENDVTIMEEMFMSPEVYIIDGTVIKDLQCESCLGEVRLYQYLIPVVIKDNTFKVWNKQYEKLFQYKFTLEYAGFRRQRTQG